MRCKFCPLSRSNLCRGAESCSGVGFSLNVRAEIASLDEKGAVEFGILLLERIGKRRGATRLLIAERRGEVRHGCDGGGDKLEVFLCHRRSVAELWAVSINFVETDKLFAAVLVADIATIFLFQETFHTRPRAVDRDFLTDREVSFHGQRIPEWQHSTRKFAHFVGNSFREVGTGLAPRVAVIMPNS